MTKIKNTKKGMAKKTLSISLAVAMLATSNVPVWAAEFTDGSDATFTSEAPAEVETPAEEVITDTEAPVVEKETADVAEATSSLVYDDTELAKFKTDEWGTKIELPSNAITYKDPAGGTVTGTINAYWTYKGNQIGNSSTTEATNKEDLANSIADINKKAPTPTKEECLEGGHFGLVVRIYVNGEINFSQTYDFGAAQCIDLTDYLANAENENFLKNRVNFPDQTYDGKEQKPAADYVDYKNPTDEEVMWGPQSGKNGVNVEEHIYIKDFAYDYVRTINGTNDLVSADRRLSAITGKDEKVDVLMKVTKPGYVGSYVYTDAFAINQRELTDEELNINFKKSSYEFTGAEITPAVSDMTAVNTVTGDDLTSFIDVVSSIGTWVESGKTASIAFEYKTDGSILRNYQNPNLKPFCFSSDNTVDIVKRDLSKCTVELQNDYSKGELDNMIRKGTAFKWGTELKVYDADHKELTSLYSYIANVVSTKDEKYYVTVKRGGTDERWVVNENTIEVATPNASLRRAKVYFEDAKTPESIDEKYREFSHVLSNGIEYTGEAYKVTKDDIYVMDWAKAEGNEAVTDNLYDIECDPTYNVGKHWVKIIGKGDYTGSTLTVWYEVTPASYKEHKLNNKVVFNDSYTSAAEYAEAIGLDVKAFNEAMKENIYTKKVDATTSKTFDLTKDDYTVEYKYNDVDANKNGNYLHNTITVTATITNPNYLDTTNMKHNNNVKVNNKGQVVITETVEIVHPSIADAKVEILGEYTFTGKKIIPEVKVTAADGTVLKEGVDYRLDVKHGEHATDKAEVVITATRKCTGEDKAKVYYEKGSVNEGNFFTIKPADITKIVASNSFEYNGEAHTPNLDQLDLELNKVDMNEFFEATMPKYFSNNVNAGTASVTLFVKDAWKGDFTAETTELNFTITPKAITDAQLKKGIFTVYAENGHILNFTAFEGFQYDGTAKTFKDAKYDSAKITLGKNNAYVLKNDKDYTIEYADNINPDQTGKDGKTSYVYVKLSPNFIAVKDKQEDGKYVASTDATITLQDGTVISNVAAQERYRIVKASVENAAVSVENPVYNFGDKVEPKVTVTVDGKALVEGTDYELVYDKDETYDATAENSKIVTVKGLNGYVGSTKVVKWGIDKKDLNSEDVTVTLDKKSYKPNEEPEVLAVVIDKNVVDASEYTVAYTDKEKGILTITGADKNFTGSKEVTYTVAVRADLADATVMGIKDEYEVTGEEIVPENIAVILNGKILTEEKDYTVTYKNNIEVGTATVTITAVEGSADYTGSIEKTFEIVEVKPLVEKTMIDRVEVVGNKATVILTGNVDGATGYDYVISTDKDCITNKDYDKVNKNVLDTETAFQYVDKGTYYAYCHAWTRDENGTKVFGEWSDAEEFTIESTTPAQPVITNVSVKGSTVTVTYTKAADALGYDVVLGTEVATVYREKRPVKYGELVKKNINGDKVTATFKNVPEGTYYAGLHAFNRTPDGGKKVFSPWSNIKTVVVK